MLRLTVSLCIFLFFSDKNLNFVGQLFNEYGNIKPWEDIKIEFHLKDTQKIYWLQIVELNYSNNYQKNVIGLQNQAFKNYKK